MKLGLLKGMGFEYTGVKPAMTEKEMNAIIDIRKITSNEPSPEIISMLSSSMEEITTPPSSRFLRGFKIIADKVKATKTKLDEEPDKEKPT